MIASWYQEETPGIEEEKTADLLMSIVKQHLDERKSLQVYQCDYLPNLCPAKPASPGKNGRYDDANAAVLNGKDPKGG